MRVAFASSDGQTIDMHFGAAERFYLWEIDADGANAIGQAVQTLTGEDREDKVITRADALKGCAIVYTTQIGGPAAAKLVARHIQPIQAKGVTSVAEAIANLQTVLRGRPPPWMRKAAGLPIVPISCAMPPDDGVVQGPDGPTVAREISEQ